MEKLRIFIPQPRQAPRRCVQAKKHMNKNHDILSYAKLVEGTNFFLFESFKYINFALTSEAAGEIFSKLINEIDPNEEDGKLLNNSLIPESPIELLQSEDLTLLSSETNSKFKVAWEKANFLAETEKHNFEIDHTVDSIDLLGHLTNLGFLVETLINRHLLFLYQSEHIDTSSYSKISKARVLERLDFIFQQKLHKDKLDFYQISRLFKLRNMTVHYTPENAIKLKPKISELVEIWNGCKKLVEAFEKVEKFNEEQFSTIINYLSNNFTKKWLIQ